MIKLPSLYKIERMIRMAPIIKEVFASAPTESDSISQIRKLEDALHDKKAEICKLRERIKELEQPLDITEELRTEAEIKLRKEGYKEL